MRPWRSRRASALRALRVSASKIPKVKFKKGQKFIRGLYSGGTFCYEATALLGNAWTEHAHRSREEAGGSLEVEGAHRSSTSATTSSPAAGRTR